MKYKNKRKNCSRNIKRINFANKSYIFRFTILSRYGRKSLFYKCLSKPKRIPTYRSVTRFSFNLFDKEQI